MCIYLYRMRCFNYVSPLHICYGYFSMHIKCIKPNKSDAIAATAIYSAVASLCLSLFLSHALSLMLSMLFLHFSGSLVLSKYIVDVWDHIGISVCIRFQTNKQTNGLTTTITNTQVENKVMNISPHIHSIHLYRFCVCVVLM